MSEAWTQQLSKKLLKVKKSLIIVKIKGVFMSEQNRPSPEKVGMSLGAQKFQDTKDRVNLSYAERITNPPEYEGYYTGICDVDNPEVALAMVKKLRECRKDDERLIMIGVMTHPVVLDSDIPVPKTVREAICEEFLAKEEISKGFIDDPDVLNTIHYADLYGPDGPWKGQEAPNLNKNLELCVKYGGENLHAIQLDVTWPDVEELRKFKEKHPEILIILQVGKFALNEADNDPQEVVDKLCEYGDSIDHVLLDLSMGKGRKMEELDITLLLRQLSLIQYELPNLGLALAGGLGPKSDESSESVYSMDALKRIVEEFPNISIDAQGGLKPLDAERDRSGHFIAKTPVDPERTGEYIEQASALLDGNKKGKQNNKMSWI